MNYASFVADKQRATIMAGIADPGSSHPSLYPFQRDCVQWALRQGRAALFEECGLGKTRQQLDWARLVAAHTGGRVLILAPLAVAHQTIREGATMGLDVCYAQSQDGARGQLVITNYDRLERFDGSAYSGVVLDESSILKAFSGKTKERLCSMFERTPFKLACTATPAPNDYLELGNHSEFLGVLTSHEMIARWFINDTSQFGVYRLKGHAVEPFWDWVASWARCVGVPSDLDPSYSDEGYVLPPLREVQHVVDVDVTEARGGQLFRGGAISATNIHRERRMTIAGRAAALRSVIESEPAEQWIIWTETNYEAEAVVAALPECVEIRGNDKAEKKEQAALAFADGKIRRLVSKPEIFGWGINWQQCARAAFVGPGFSYEGYYQTVRRNWRFGQRRAVDVHVFMAPTEVDVWNVVRRKAADHDRMKVEMFAAMRRAQAKADTSAHAYCPTHRAALPAWLRSET